MNIRLLGPPIAATVTTNGRSYSGAPGNVYDVIDRFKTIFIVLVIPRVTQLPGCSGRRRSTVTPTSSARPAWTKLAPSGPTSARPTTSEANGIYYVVRRGFRFFDKTVGKLFVFDRAAWRDHVLGS